MAPSLLIRRAGARDAAAIRELRLEALRLHPTSFTADLEANERHPITLWEERASEEGGCILLAFVGDQSACGMVGIRRGEVPKTRHAATIWGAYVRREARGAQIGRRLIDAAVDWARERDIVIVKLAVIASNAAAVRCYQNAGFVTYGTEPAAIFHDGGYYDEHLMALRLR